MSRPVRAIALWLGLALAAMGCGSGGGASGAAGSARATASSAEAPTALPSGAPASASAATSTASAASTASALGSSMMPASVPPLALATSYEGPRRVDLWIRGGTVVDGTGAPGVRADVVVSDGSIVHVGAAPGALDAERIVDAAGKLVCPGFIDTHAHGDATADNANFLAQGVTTIVLGQDGRSPSDDRIATWVKRSTKKRLALNAAALTGHGTLRSAAGIGGSKSPTPEQIEKLARLVEQDLEAGAFGLSTGLEYAPGRWAPTEELVAVAKPVASHDGVVMSHMRSEDDDQIDAAIDELIAQGKGAGARVHVAHIKVVYGHGAERAEQILERLARARADGVRVTAGIYPYTASYTTIGIVFPPWASGGSSFKRAKQERREELEAYLRERVRLRNGPEATLFGTGGLRGKTLADLAKERGKPFEDVLIDDIGPSGGAAAFFVMDDALQSRLLVDPHVMIASDGSATSRHPRGYGTFARVIEEYVGKRKALPIEQAVAKMTGLPAATLRLERQKRGLVRPGWAADLVIFDPSRVEARASFEEPNRLAAGFDDVLVNGVLVRSGGKRTAARPGKVLRPSEPEGGEAPQGK